VAAQSKAVCGRLPAKIVGSNPTEGLDICLLWVFVLAGRDFCDDLITRPEESYQLWSVVVCDLENFVNEETMARVGPQRQRKKI
jgi:hypothetical protein